VGQQVELGCTINLENEKWYFDVVQQNSAATLQVCQEAFRLYFVVKQTLSSSPETNNLYVLHIPV
jgi:hypothetical protein